MKLVIIKFEYVNIYEESYSKRNRISPGYSRISKYTKLPDLPNTLVAIDDLDQVFIDLKPITDFKRFVKYKDGDRIKL